MNFKMFKVGGAVAGAMMGLMATTALAQDCGPEGQSIRILGNDFPAIQALANTAQALCGDAAAEITTTLRDDTRDMMNQAQTPNPAQYTSVIVANATLTQLMNDGLVRPLNDLVEKYGDNISPNQLITIEGNVMAVAFMANAQHLFSRMDILEQVGITEPPATVEEVLAAAQAIREAGIMEHPIVMNASGWNLGELFNLFFFGHGGQLFMPGTAEPNINNEIGVATLESIKALAEYAHPDYLSHASNETQGIWEAGQAALGIMWGSRGGAILDDEGASERGSFFHSPGEPTRQLFGLAAKLDLVEEAIERPAQFLLVGFAVLSERKEQVVAHCQRIEERSVLEDEADSTAQRREISLVPTGDFLAVDSDGSGVGPDESVEVFQEDALPRSAAAEDDRGPLRRDVEIDSTEDGASAQRRLDPAEGKVGGGGIRCHRRVRMRSKPWEATRSAAE